MKDFAQYIGMRFEEGSLDCWILARKVLAEQFGISNLPSLGSKYSDSRDNIIPELVEAEAKRAWSRVDSPMGGDVVVFRILGLPAHVGVMIDQKNFIHAIKGSETCLERIDSPKWKPRIENFYRYVRR